MTLVGGSNPFVRGSPSPIAMLAAALPSAQVRSGQVRSGQSSMMTLLADARLGDLALRAEVLHEAAPPLLPPVTIRDCLATRQ